MLPQGGRAEPLWQCLKFSTTFEQRKDYAASTCHFQHIRCLRGNAHNCFAHFHQAKSRNSRSHTGRKWSLPTGSNGWLDKDCTPFLPARLGTAQEDKGRSWRQRSKVALYQERSPNRPYSSGWTRTGQLRNLDMNPCLEKVIRGVDKGKRVGNKERCNMSKNKLRLHPSRILHG